MKEISKIQFITDSPNSHSILKQVEEIASSNINWLQFRMKNESYESKLAICHKIKLICASNNTKFIVNDDVYLAKEVGADGVHLGLSDMNPQEAREILGEELIIGATCNSLEDIIERQKQGVDYIGLGPLRFTSTKKNLSATLGFNGYTSIIKEMRQRGINIPIIAIGGIRTEDIDELMEIGLHGIAISSLINQSENKENTINQILKKIN